METSCLLEREMKAETLQNHSDFSILQSSASWVPEKLFQYFNKVEAVFRIPGLTGKQIKKKNWFTSAKCLIIRVKVRKQTYNI